MSDLAAVKALVAGVVERFGGVDILINNAGVSIPASAADASDEEFDAAWQRTIAVNLTAQALLVRAALPYLRARRRGAGREHRLDRGPDRHGRASPPTRPASTGSSG